MFSTLLALTLAATPLASADGGAQDFLELVGGGDEITSAPDPDESSDGEDGAFAQNPQSRPPAAEAADLIGDGSLLYSADLSDAELTRLWVEAPDQIGSISVGITEAGRLVNGVQMKDGAAWDVIDENNAWGAKETVDFITAAATSVREQYPECPSLRINHIGKQNGGYLRPHQSHQAGRDVDLGFYYPVGEDPGNLSKKRELAMDLATNWALVKTLITSADVEFILVDKRIQARLYAYALEHGEDKAWLDKVFTGDWTGVVRHARRHRDHFHVRFYAGRSQELGRRIQPLLSKQPDQNLVIHKVKSGDTLGGLAARYNSGVKLIQKANGMTNTSLRVGRTLNIPLRGPCTNCPEPPPLVIPPRLLPPPPPPKS
ncbi:MAG: penicillin-insensitive murein endopeptidase [Archangium sp.]|nr:penicillin-insensitive murein endopeptidase [Archangium sp.]